VLGVGCCSFLVQACPVIFVCYSRVLFVIGTSLGYVECYWQVVQMDVLGSEYVEGSTVGSGQNARKIYIIGANGLILDHGRLPFIRE
jgi:hypothetical protein